MSTKQDMQKDLEILLTADRIVGPAGMLEIDSGCKLALFNALKPLITRKHKALIKERLQKMASEAQADLVEELADKAVDGMLKGAAKKIAEKRQP